MTKEIKCPHCGISLTVDDESVNSMDDDELAGMKCLCPNCGAKFPFPNSKSRSENLEASDNQQNATLESREQHLDPIQRKCSSCGANIETGMRFCSQCGTMSTSWPRICINCHMPIEAGMHFCHKCGLLITEKYEKTFFDHVDKTVKGATNMVSNFFGKIKRNFKGEVNQ